MHGDAPFWMTLLGMAFTGGFMTALLNRLYDWVSRRDRKQSDRIAETVEQAIRVSPTILEIKDKLDRDYQRQNNTDERLEKINSTLKTSEEGRVAARLEVLRMSLFMAPHDQYSHIHSMNDGKRYLELGGNGEGHAQYNRLVKDYQDRLKYNDWDYTPGHRIGEME